MNILEAEDMVKGLPDQVLFQIAQSPPPNIPQFLAVSEVQRRQDMRQRYQAKQPEQTVKDQILQGGIASAGGPPPGEPPPMAPPGAAPPGAPMQQPMTGAPMGEMFRGGMTRMANGGLTPGGIVYMQEGRKVPSFLERSGLPFVTTPEGVAANRETLAGLLSPRRAQFSVVREAQALRSQGRLDEAVALLRQEGIDPRQVFGEQPASAPVAPPAPPAAAPGPVDFMAAQRGQPPMNFNTPPPTPQAAPQGEPSAPSVSPGGIGDLAPRPPAGGMPSYLANILKPQERLPEVQAAIDLNRQMAEQSLPPPVDLTQYIQSAQQRQQEAKDESRRMAIANTLMGLGTGLVAGDPAAGLQRATQMATETLREGRKEAQAEGRMAEQLQLQSAQQQRQSIMDAMKFKSESVNAIASLVSGEQKANRNDMLQAAQIVATYNSALDKNRAELESQGRLDERSERTARTSAIRAAQELYLSNPTNVMGKTSEQVAKEVRDIAKMLDPDSFGSAETSGSAPVVVSHQGKQYSFPTKEAADTFKRQLGI